jgi:hypothetical protein
MPAEPSTDYSSQVSLMDQVPKSQHTDMCGSVKSDAFMLPSQERIRECRWADLDEDEKPAAKRAKKAKARAAAAPSVDFVRPLHASCSDSCNRLASTSTALC